MASVGRIGLKLSLGFVAVVERMGEVEGGGSVTEDGTGSKVEGFVDGD